MTLEASTKTKVLLDTDIGSDIDDAICLAYLLAQPACDLLGITTVSGEAQKRAMLASALCEVAGRDVPIYPGIERPLLSVVKQPTAPQAEALARWQHKQDFPQNEAITFLEQTIRAHPGEVSLLAIGPMTNIALLFATYPDIPYLLKSLVLMCGQFAPSGREWNALNDPYAAEIVYRAPVAVHRSIGLDVTTQVRMPASEFRQHCDTPLLRPVLDFAEVWFQQSETVTFHDPLAAATIFDRSLCSFSYGNVSVEIKDEAKSGQTYWQPGGIQTRHEVALAVNVEGFLKHYFGVFSKSKD
ncbi:nucleoside hydrolase [Ktedonospora formicarum]|uniref:Inosine/uridine-preferring nucleoside hydrolase domain-containing protein n=1 Tax=Ktedonospora formicarum TaxID=2778364 RepID=A0A8J3I397_9CHLR|nr:nucleoside hydrolase [Ktedonospora formicarum]GHO47976.1 hypothetical protein KSX_61390 [Ktedonospora formicarum]